MIEKTKKLKDLKFIFSKKIFLIKITLNIIAILILSIAIIYLYYQNIKISKNNNNLEAEINSRKQRSNAQKEEINNLVNQSRSLYEQVICDNDNCFFKNQNDQIFGYFTITGYFEQVMTNPNRNLFSYRFYIEPINEKLLALINKGIYQENGKYYIYLGDNYSIDQNTINKVNKSNRFNLITIMIKKFSDCGYSYDSIYDCRDKIEIINS